MMMAEKERGRTIAGRRLPPGYSLMEDPMRACFHITGPAGRIGSIERRFAADDISEFADEVVERCYEDAERRARAKYQQQMMMNKPADMVCVDVERLKREDDEMNDATKSPAALARFHREAVRAGRVKSGHIDGSYSSLFNELAEKGLLPSRGERFGEPPVTSKPEGRRKPSPVLRRSAKEECRDIERMGAHSWLLERHNEFVRDVRLP